tara:strand:- start:54 stop:722 length:669 start_codon:yes stop_codon:yes gene_type:complete
VSVEADLLAALVQRTYETVLRATGDQELALVSATVVQRNGLADLGAPQHVLDALDAEIARLRALIDARDPAMLEPPEPRYRVPPIPTPSVPGFDAIKDWIGDRLGELADLVGTVAGKVRDAAVAAVQATIPTLADVALSLVGTVGDTLGFMGENLAQLDDVALALADGVGGGLEAAAGEVGNRIASAAGNSLTFFLDRAADAAELVAPPFELGGPMRYEARR